MKRPCAKHLLPLFVFTFVIFSAVFAQSAVIYVDSTATGAADGSSWSDAYTDLQSAIAAALSGDEIWVAAATYFPTATTIRSATFQLPTTNVSIYGGFTGTETTLGQRDFATNVTILSGEIGVDTTIADNSYHVVTGDGADSTSVLDGFTITAGNASGLGADGDGGGVSIIGGSPTLRNVIITRNDAVGSGGGLYCEFCAVNVFDATVTMNDGQLGGGMYNTALSTPEIIRVTFTLNNADDGGGMFNDLNSDAYLENVVFDTEDANFSGGALYNVASDPYLINCLFVNNTANDDGGAIYNSASDTKLINVTINNNTAGFDGGAIFNTESNPTITNVIMWGNNASLVDEIFNSASTPVISHSLVQGSGGSGVGWDPTFGTDGGNNIDSDPFFVDEFNGNLRLTVCSPAIDAGSDAAINVFGVTTDLDGNTRILFDAVDMGAYESLEPAGLIVYVDKNATGAADGTSWADAYTELRVALAQSLCNPTDIWVAEGTYLPTDSLDRTKTFTMFNNVAIFGGFKGTETFFNQRDILNNPTILSGDIGVVADSTDNSNHVVTGSGTDSTAVLDGFTVTDGNGRQGGGIIIAGGSPTIANVQFDGNVAEDFGGAMYNAFGSNPTMINVVFTDNDAKDGGAMCNDNSSNPKMINTTVAGNRATGSGGGIDNVSGSTPTIVNSIFWANTAPIGPQISNQGLSQATISYSDIQDSGGSGVGWDPSVGIDGGNNVDSNPLFLDLANGNTRINPGSPVINIGNNSAVPAGVTEDLDSKTRISGGTVDMGAYEFQSDPNLFAFPDPMFFQALCDTVTLVNVGGATLNISSIGGCNTIPFSIDTSMTNHTLTPGDTTIFLVCLQPPAGNDSCSVTITSNASNSPTKVLVILDVVTGIGDDIPKPFRILAVAPNPFNPTTTVHFTLPEAMPVTTEIFSVSGARVRVLTANRRFGAGNNSVTWDGRNDHGSTVASGVYFVQMKTRLGAKVTRAVLLK